MTLCTYCATAEATEQDHVLPRCRGGSDGPANLVPCCRSCNAVKGKRTPAEWVRAGSAPAHLVALLATDPQGDLDLNLPTRTGLHP